MRQAVLIVDVQPSFSPPKWLIERCQKLSDTFPSVASIERHDELVVPFNAQLGWAPTIDDNSLVRADHEFVKHGYRPTKEILQTLLDYKPDRVLVCGLQAETCVLAAGFALFDHGLRPTLVADAVAGSSLDPSGQLGARLWTHHFGQVVDSHQSLVKVG